jgi:hypothetical protein
MKNIPLIFGVIALLTMSSTMAFSTDEERINDFLNTLEVGSFQQKEQMLNRLQWSGLTSSKLYDNIARRVETQYTELNLEKRQLNLVAYQVRALGYSGNEIYRKLITDVSQHAGSQKLKRHAKKALSDLDQFVVWNTLIADSSFSVEGKSAETTMYMKMLSIDDFFVQRLAARAIFHEQLQDADLLDLASDKLKALYLHKNLDAEWQDTASWLCKAIGQNGAEKHIELLSQVAKNTPHRKINKYASKYLKQK